MNSLKKLGKDNELRFFFSLYLFGAMIGSCFGKFFLGFLSSLGGLIQFGLSLQFLLYFVVECSSATKDSTTMGLANFVFYWFWI
jgi:hypothetical protein